MTTKEDREARSRALENKRRADAEDARPYWQVEDDQDARPGSRWEPDGDEVLDDMFRQFCEANGVGGDAPDPSARTRKETK